MKYNILNYLIGEGFRNVFKNKKSTIASLTIMCATMLAFGIFFAIGENIDHMMTELEQSQGIQIFIKNGSTDEQIKKVGEDIKALNGVNTVTFVSKEQALNQMKENFKDQEYLLDGLEEIFPVSYVVTFTDLSFSTDIQKQISQMDNIKNITNKNDTTSTLMSIGSILRISTAALLGFLIIISIFIISNTIKLTVDSRKKEISIMKYVGATNNFIRWPFIVEGIVIGLMSAVLSILIIGGSYNVLADTFMKSDLMIRISVSLLGFSELFFKLTIVYILLGIGIGIVGSSISMKKYLNV